MNLYMNKAYAKAATACRRRNPCNRATLDIPEVLETATEEVKKERGIVMRSREISNPLDVSQTPSPRDLLTTGSGRLAGGADAVDQLEKCAGALNYEGLQLVRL